ncbi:MAG: carboxy-S-adenosyl-L-methionine synthase CmoA [Aureliella sp.]
MKKDEIFAHSSRKVGDFAFDDAVADVFPDMISRSVPGYASVLAMIGELAEKYVQPESNVYDLGCSLGAASFMMQPRVPASCRIIAVDNSAAMLSRLQSKLESEPMGSAICPISLVEDDIRDCEVSNASMVVLNLTLQFVPVAERLGVLQSIFRGLIPGGALLLAEKLRFDDVRQHELLTELHHDFKRAHGYSDLEISEKRTAIENRLIPETMQEHCERLILAGFNTVVPWFQCFNFTSFLAVKD